MNESSLEGQREPQVRGEMEQVNLMRRSLLAAGAVGLLVGAKGPQIVRPLPVPEVDSVSVQVITDNAVFGPFLDNSSLPGLTVTRMGGGPPHATRMSSRALMAEFGLSLVATSKKGGDVRKVMVDFGYSPEVLSNNLALLNVDPATISAAVLSHGHLDHYGGFAGLFGPTAPSRHLPLTVGGEETFCERIAQIGNPPPVMGALDRVALANAGYEVRIQPDPAIIADHAFTTGIIPLRSFERAAIPTQMRPGIGCDRALLAPAKRNLTQVADDGEHELATCYAIKGLGLVVIASCSHRGVLNSVRRAQEVSGINRVHAVIGGFHLVRPRTEDEARRTVAEFVKMDPSYIIPMHCTGEVFIQEALRLMPNKVVRPYVGTVFKFSPS